MRRPIAFHPLLVAAFPVLFLYGQNVDEVALGDALPLLAVAIAGTAAVFALASALLRDHHRGALVTSGLGFLFFSFGHVWEALDGALNSRFLLLALWVALAAGIVALAVLHRRAMPQTTKVLNIVATVLVVTSLAPVATALASPSNAAEQTLPDDAGAIARAADPDAPRRDIWYVVLDRYARGDTLAELFDYDNRPFLNDLEQRGFTVADGSLANYPKTAHALAAALNLRYLDRLAETAGPSNSSWLPVYRLLQDHVLGDTLTDLGYRYLHLANWWDGTETADSADRTYAYGSANEFTQVFELTTALPAVRDVLGLDGDLSDRQLKYRTTLFQFDQLERLAREDPDDPRFVFAHITLPHEPYVFDADGSYKTREDEEALSRRDNFVAQTEYANHRVRRLLDLLLGGDPDTDPIVVLQSDEGPHPVRYDRHQRSFVWPEATDVELAEKLRILNAYYLPGVEGSPIYDEITPVNSFRVILDAYFGTDLGTLPDEVYVFYDRQHLYDFSEVTDRLR